MEYSKAESVMKACEESYVLAGRAPMNRVSLVSEGRWRTPGVPEEASVELIGVTYSVEFFHQAAFIEEEIAEIRRIAEEHEVGTVFGPAPMPGADIGVRFA